MTYQSSHNLSLYLKPPTAIDYFYFYNVYILHMLVPKCPYLHSLFGNNRSLPVKCTEKHVLSLSWHHNNSSRAEMPLKNMSNKFIHTGKAEISFKLLSFTDVICSFFLLNLWPLLTTQSWLLVNTIKTEALLSEVEQITYDPEKGI